MKTFEERYTAWIDGTLPDAEVAEFEHALPERATADADRRSARQLGDLLRTRGIAPPLTNGDFFNHQLRERLAAEERQPAAETRRPAFAWPLGHLAWAGVCSLLLAFSLYKTLIPSTFPPVAPQLATLAQITTGAGRQWDYAAQIVAAQPADPSISATTLHSDADKVTVLWLGGLDYLPADYELQ